MNFIRTKPRFALLNSVRNTLDKTTAEPEMGEAPISMSNVSFMIPAGG